MILGLIKTCGFYYSGTNEWILWPKEVKIVNSSWKSWPVQNEGSGNSLSKRQAGWVLAKSLGVLFIEVPQYFTLVPSGA